MQSAYRKIHSTETAILKVQNDLLLAVDKGYEAVLVLLDFSAAFDLIDHDILLNRLEKRFGLCGTPLSWIMSYLSHRKQFVSVGNNTSNEESINRGVPQGSVLGCYCSPCTPRKLKICRFIAHSMDAKIYTDNTQFYIALKDTNRSESLQRHCTDDIRSWSTLNKLVLNDGKTEPDYSHYLQLCKASTDTAPCNMLWKLYDYTETRSSKSWTHDR